MNVELSRLTPEKLLDHQGVVEKDSLIDHMTGGIFNGRPFVCCIEGCGGDGFVVYPMGILCRKHEAELMAILAEKKNGLREPE